MYKDGEGNVISKLHIATVFLCAHELTSSSADPDRSNPTRHRLERPLDTIRSFNAAAEGTSSRRSSFNRPSMS